MINSSKDNKPNISKYLPGSSKSKSSTAARTAAKITGGHITDSGHTIGLTTDEQQKFRELLSNAVHDINTDSSFTPEQKRDLIKSMPGMSDKNHDFYRFLNIQYRTGPELAAEIRRLIGADRAKR